MGERISRRTVAALLVGYCVLLLGVLLGPASVPSDGVGWIGDVAARLGAPDRLLVPSRVEFIVNGGVIAPAAALGSVVWPRTTWRDWTAYGFLFSASIELTQGLLLPTRSARFDDIAGTRRCRLRAAGEAGRCQATLTGAPIRGPKMAHI